MKNNLYQAKEDYLNSLSEEEKQITLSLWRQKSLEGRKAKSNEKKKILSLAEIASQLGNCDYVVFDDDDEVQNSITINEKCIIAAYERMINNPKTTFKDINDLQKVIKNDTEDGKGIVNVTFVTGGQDLGE